MLAQYITRKAGLIHNRPVTPAWYFVASVPLHALSFNEASSSNIAACQPAVSVESKYAVL
jgi:hypothetical protein